MCRKDIFRFLNVFGPAHAASRRSRALFSDTSVSVFSKSYVQNKPSGYENTANNDKRADIRAFLNLFSRKNLPRSMAWSVVSHCLHVYWSYSTLHRFPSSLHNKQKLLVFKSD